MQGWRRTEIACVVDFEEQLPEGRTRPPKRPFKMGKDSEGQ
jgi:hypothetical protein